MVWILSARRYQQIQEMANKLLPRALEAECRCLVLETLYHFETKHERASVKPEYLGASRECIQVSPFLYAYSSAPNALLERHSRQALCRRHFKAEASDQQDICNVHPLLLQRTSKPRCRS